MGLRINTNTEAFNSHRQLVRNSSALAKSMEKLSSGFRINRAADDAAGLGISEKMRAQINGVAQAQRNAQDGMSLVQTAEGALQEFHSILHRIRDLAVQFNNGIYDNASKAAITSEVAQLSAELGRLISVAQFNGIPLLAGNLVTNPIMATLQVGANNGEVMTLGAVDGFATVSGSVANFANAAPNAYIDINEINAAIERVSTVRATFGAIQNRLEHTVNSLAVYQENLQAAESRIRDVDMAQEMTTFTRMQILQQASTAMLAQANQAPQSVLSLLQ